MTKRTNGATASPPATGPGSAAAPPTSPAGYGSPVALATAAAMVVLCLLPFFLRVRPYPPGIVDFWEVGLLVVGPLAIVAGLIRAPWIDAAVGRAKRLALAPPPLAFAVLVALVAMAGALYMSFHVFERSPSTSDEIAQLWHAKIMLTGRLALPADLNPEFFAIDNVIDRGLWYSHFPIGGPMALVPGVLIGAPWLVNPVLAGLAVAAFYHFFRRAFGETEGRAAAALLAVTPNILLMAGTYLNHVPTLFFAGCAFAALAEWDRAATTARGMGWAAAVGAAIGAAATIRPLDAVVLAVVIGAFQLAIVARKRHRAVELVVVGVAGLLAVAPLLYANWRTNGSAFRFGYDVMWGEGHRVGFHTDPHGTQHTPMRALQYALQYVAQTNYAVLAWPVPTLAVAFVGLAAMRRATRWDVLLMGFLAVQLAAYAAYWGLGEFLGPRFLFTAFPALIALVARAPFLVGAREGPRAGRGMAAFVVLCVAVSWGAPKGFDAVRGSIAQVHAARQPMRVNIARTVEAAGLHHALVFLRETFSARLLHRVWGVGVSRPDALTLIETRDACSLLSAVEQVERDSAHAIANPAAFLGRTATMFVRGPQQFLTPDPNVRITSEGSVTPSCRAAFDDFHQVPAFFGAALPLEPIGPDGHLAGDVIYAMDLDAHNEALRRRFGDRAWYRLSLGRASDGALVSSVRAY